MEEITLKMDMNPIERLTKEIEMEDDPATKSLGELLLEEFKINDLIANAYKEKTRRLKDCYKALENFARDNHRTAISDKEATGIVLHYIQDGVVTKYKDITLTKEEQEDLKEKAREQFIESEKLRLRQAENERLQKEQQAKQKYQEKEQAKYDKLNETQMSLFDL